MKIILIVLLLTGCVNVPVKYFPLDGELLSPDTATAIIYTRQRDTFVIAVDGVDRGTITQGDHLKIEVEPGTHKLWVMKWTMDRVTEFTFEAGEVYYFSAYWYQTLVPGLTATRVVNVRKRAEYQNATPGDMWDK